MNVARVHHAIVQGLIDKHACPSNAELARSCSVDEAGLEALLRDLAAIHGVVLHPHVCEPWLIHPFSITPTLNWIQGESGGWWAPCIWCAFGVAALAGGETAIHTRWGAEAEALVIAVRDGIPQASNPDIWVHFAIPPSRAWLNVHQHCSLVLPFRSPAEIAAWCERHRVPMGEAVPLTQVAELARVWYGRHADPDWQKWTMAEAQEIFHRVRLQSPFWDLEVRAGKFQTSVRNLHA